MNTNTILVTGASGNLGTAVVNRFLQEGWLVVAVTHKNRPIKRQDQNLISINAELTDELSAQNTVHLALQRFGKIDAAVLCAGGFISGRIEQTSIANILYQFQINFATAYNIVRPLLAEMKKAGKGKIFLIGSKQGEDTHNGTDAVAYSLSKSLLFQLANIINVDVQNNNSKISATIIVPSIIDTPQNRSAMPNADFAKWQSVESIADSIFDSFIHQR